MDLELEKLCAEYVKVNSYGQENGRRKSELHRKISELLAKNSTKTADEIHDESKQITDNLDVSIFLPIYRKLSDVECKNYGRKLVDGLLRFV